MWSCQREGQSTPAQSLEPYGVLPAVGPTRRLEFSWKTAARKHQDGWLQGCHPHS